MPQNNLRRRVQVVSTKSDRKKVIKWMISYADEHGSENRIAAKAVKEFPKLFSQQIAEAHKSKVLRSWKKEEEFLNNINSKENKNL